MPPVRRRLGITLAAVATSLIAACGSSGNSGNGGVGTGGHDSPENATRGFINALAGFNGTSASFTPVLDWINPSTRPTVQTAIGLFASQAGSIKLYFQQVNIGSASTSSDGVHASVPVGGSLCFAESSSGGAATTSCSTGTSIGANAVKCVKEGGQWYIDGSLFTGGSSGSATDSTSSTASVSSTDTGTSTDTGLTSSST